nr:zinc finger protein 69-like [Procambarus clarkii]XP_045613511.1 zinc finger protein 69-like [Procambarus clarkii]XP_045613512.1 zinc finger protein 69-like [Procambarus clarkii]
MESSLDSWCLVCNKLIKEASVNINSNLAAKNGTILSQISRVVSSEDVLEACRVSEVVCSLCLKILLNIVNLECKIVTLQNEFRETFKSGIESRKGGIDASLTAQVMPRLTPDEDLFKEPRVCANKEWSVNPGSEQGYQGDSIKTFTNISGEESDIIDCSNHDLLSENRSECEKTFSIKFDLCDSVENEQCNDIGKLSFNHARKFSELVPSHNLEGNTEASCITHNDDDQRITFKKPKCESSLPDCPSSPTSEHLADTVKLEDCDQPTSSIEICPVETENAGRSTSVFTDMNNLDVSVCIEEENINNSTIVRNGTTKTRPRRCKRQTKLQRHKRKKKVKETEVEIEVDVLREVDFEDDWSLKEDESSERGENNMMTCELCGERFSDAKQLAKHRGDVHASVYCHVCEKCTDTRYREKAKLTQHLRRIHKVPVHQCPACDHEAPSQNSLDQHIISNHPDSRFFECRICLKAFRTYRYLNFVHIKRCHFVLPIKYTCEKCNKGFVDKSSFENHKIIHSGTRNFSCKFCGAMFQTSYALKVHVNTHTQDKKYVCVDCGSAFLRICNLSAHKKRFHSSDDVRLLCEVCGKSMATQKDLRRHQLAHHSKERPFACGQCPRSYTAKESLKSHLRTHTGEKPFKCACGKAFHKSTVLRRHQRCVHVGDDFQQDAFSGHDVRNTVQVDEEHMVVITLKECNPPAVYTVQNAPTHLQEIMVSNETHPHSGSLIAENVPPSHDAGLPLLHQQLGTISTGRIGLSTPVLFTTLDTNSISVQHGQDTIQDGISSTSFSTDVTSIGSDLQATSLPFQQAPSSLQSKEQDSLASFPTETPVTCSPLATQLLQLPALQTSSASSAPVTFIATWPSSAL